MLLYNLDIENSLVNGSQGWVIDFKEDNTIGGMNALVYILGNKRIELSGRTAPSPVKYPFEEKNKEEINKYLDKYKNFTVPIQLQFSTFKDKFTGKETVFRMQIPLRPCYGLTVQKSQGSTFKKTLIVPSMMNKHTGLLYTAFTRNTSFDGFSVYDEDFVEDYFSAVSASEKQRVINKFCIEKFTPIVSQKVLNFNSILKESTRKFIEIDELLNNENSTQEDL